MSDGKVEIQEVNRIQSFGFHTDIVESNLF